MVILLLILDVTNLIEANNIGPHNKKDLRQQIFTTNRQENQEHSVII